MRVHWIALALVLVLASFAACGGGGRGPEPGAPVASPPPATKASPAELDRIDVFGSKRLGRDEVLARWGDRLAELVRRGPGDDALWQKKTALEAEIGAAGDLAFVDLAIVGYHAGQGAYLTVDLVDAEDRARRMRFGPEPTGTPLDPDGLIALWREYEEKMWKLMDEGAVRSVVEKCPFWHCITFAHESLIPYRDAFAKRVQPVERELAAVLREDRRAVHRAAAAFLLAHLPSGERVVELMLPSITDPDALVRNNAMRVLAMIAREHPEIPIPLAPILEALHFPTTLDRNKAAAIIEGITRRGVTAEVRAQILGAAGDVLVDMLALKQPNNHDFAYLILKHLAGRDLGEHAVDAWRAWARAPR